MDAGVPSVVHPETVVGDIRMGHQTVDVVCAVISDGRATMTGDSETTVALPLATTPAQHVSLVTRAQTSGLMHYAIASWFSTAHLV